MRRLSLVGYRSCGKSTLGPLVAARLGWPFVDLDHAITARIKMPIAF
jgi:shikimate kinase